MGIIIERKRADGTTGYTAQIRKKKAGKTVYSMCQTFDRKQAADTWLKKTEKDLLNGTRLPQLRQREKTLEEVITQYATILVELARSLKKGRKAQTVGNYMMHLSAIFFVASTAYNADLKESEMRKALKICRKLQFIKKSSSRSRRLSLDELEKLMTYFECSSQRTNASPMHKIIGFAIVSTRRLSEITLLPQILMKIPARKSTEPPIRSPSQCPGTARPSTSAGLSLIDTASLI